MKLVAIVFVGFTIAGCSTDARRSQGWVAISSVAAPRDDNQDLFDANVVTNLAGLSVQATVFCSGILLTRTRLLTASHCVVGLPNLSVGPSPNVQVGSVEFGTTSGTALPSDTPPVVPISELGHYTDANNLADVGADIALLVLDEASLDAQIHQMYVQPLPPGQADDAYGTEEKYATTLDATNWGNLLGTHVVRPSLTTPSTDAIGFASWGTAAERQLRTFTATLTLGADSFSVRASGASAGDSGSPLFTTRADGSRDPFGILSGGDGSDDVYFVDLTSPRNSAWIVSQLIDHSHDAQPKWKKMHPPVEGHSDWWIGEDDYSGRCIPAFDADCDHWVDSSDNCPQVFNHDQTDSDDDGIGDACPP